MRFIILFIVTLSCGHAHPVDYHQDPFRQLDEVLPTPSNTRAASGAPGHKYWQQQADYDIAVTLDEDNHRISGTETITYYNNSPDTLKYLWVQLDRNHHHPNAPGHQSSESPNFDDLQYEHFRMMLYSKEFDGAYKIKSVTDADGKALPHSIVQTMMRINLPVALKSKEKIQFSITWDFNINDRLKSWARSGFEVFKEDNNALYQMAQFFPRVAAYTDVNGWNNKQFLGRGEFALEFGDYTLAITVPADHIVASTGVLQNSDDVYSEKTKQRLEEASKAKKPMFIVSPAEAKEALKSRSKDTKTWIFKAKNVRDFAFASSRRFIWDAVLHPLPNSDKKVWAMSYYPPEAEPLWSQYSTNSVIHALNVYSKFTFDYPYPVAISVHGKIWGMEYPMISFNGARPEEDGTYTEKTKKGLISVIIHEVGHNWFPMIVNSDERQWTWMDEGINSFIQILAEEEWSKKPYNIPNKKKKIIKYMTSQNQRPIMTNSESILQFGDNAYRKPAVALVYLRETIMGREHFDFAFKEYANRWRFKRPEPADFFRSMEDASGIDLDWFWQGWFYTTDHLDLSLGEITEFKLESGHPSEEKAREKEEYDQEVKRNKTHSRNAKLPKFTDNRSELRDFYDDYDPFSVSEKDEEKFKKSIKDLKDEDKDLWKTEDHFYRLTIENKGGLVAPVLLEITDIEGNKERHNLPAEIWKKNAQKIHKLLITDKKIVKVSIDPDQESPESDFTNNSWPREIQTKPFTLKARKNIGNPMREAQREKDDEGESQ